MYYVLEYFYLSIYLFLVLRFHLNIRRNAIAVITTDHRVAV